MSEENKDYNLTTTNITTNKNSSIPPSSVVTNNTIQQDVTEEITTHLPNFITRKLIHTLPNPILQKDDTNQLLQTKSSFHNNNANTNSDYSTPITTTTDPSLLRNRIDWDLWRRNNPSSITTRRTTPQISALSSIITNDTSEEIFINVCLATTTKLTAVIDDSPTIGQALKSNEYETWKIAIQKEVNSILENKFLTALPDHFEFPKTNNYRFVRTTTKLKRKYKPNGDIDKLKARTCARGDLLPTSDPTLTYSPTISFLMFMFFLQIAVINGMFRANFDTVSAFLRTSFEPTDIPTFTKLEPIIASICNLNPDTIYQMNCHFYGLPDASRAYYKAYSTLLIANGYKQSMVDGCIFFKVNETEATYILIYVDDTYVFSTSSLAIETLKQIVRTKYPIEDRSCSEFLGIEITSLSDGSLLLRQPKLIHDLLTEFPRRTYAHQTSTPQTHHPIHRTTLDNISSTKYQHLLGILIHLTKTRIEISMAVSMASTAQKSPTTHDYEDLLQIVDYLHEHPDKGLIIKKHSTDPLQLYCHVDASYMLHPDARSHSGYSLSFSPSGPAFFCKSKKQQLVATSAMHAETRALYQLTLQIIQLHLVAIEIELPLQLPTIIFEDNAPLIYTTTNPIARTVRCKHFLMILNFIKEQVHNNIIQLIKIPSELNPADSLAKPTYGKDFKNKTSHLTCGQNHNIILNNSNISK